MLWKNLWNLWRSRVVFPENSLWKTHFPRDNLSACPKHRIFIHNFVIFNFVENIYNTTVVVDYFCKNQQEIEELYNLTPIIRNLRKDADLLNAFFIEHQK